MDAKHQDLLAAFEEIDKLEEELKICDNELELLHSHVIDLENDKRNLMAQLESLRKSSSENLDKERSDHLTKLLTLRKENEKLLTQLYRVRSWSHLCPLLFSRDS